MGLINRIIRYLWNYYYLSNNDSEHMDELRNDILAFEKLMDEDYSKWKIMGEDYNK